jgi:hypothetical protein
MSVYLDKPFAGGHGTLVFERNSRRILQRDAGRVEQRDLIVGAAMSVDLVHPAVEKVTLVLEGPGDEGLRQFGEFGPSFCDLGRRSARNRGDREEVHDACGFSIFSRTDQTSSGETAAGNALHHGGCERE